MGDEWESEFFTEETFTPGPEPKPEAPKGNGVDGEAHPSAEGGAAGVYARAQQAKGQAEQSGPQPGQQPGPQPAGPKRGPRFKRRETPESSPNDVLEYISANEIPLEAIEWLWLYRFAIGKLGIIGGLPERGKGLITADVIARVTNGWPWPCGEGTAPKGNVILLTAEDAERDTVAPRLKAAGADMKRVKIVRALRQEQGNKRMFSLVTDVHALEKMIKDIGDVVLIIVDPLSAYLGVNKIDAFRQTDVRGVLAPLVALAEEYRIAVIGVMHFNKKEGTKTAMLRLADSVAFVAAPRHVYVVLDKPDEPGTRLFARAKNNLSAIEQDQTLEFTTAEKYVGEDVNKGVEIRAPHVVWGTAVAITADEVLRATEGEESNRAGARTEAKEWFKGFMADGEYRSPQEIYNAAAEAGYSESTIQRAVRGLPIKKKSAGDRNSKLWALAKDEKES